MHQLHETNLRLMCWAKIVCKGLIPRRRNSSRENIFAKYGWLHMIESFEIVNILSFRSE